MAYPCHSLISTLVALVLASLNDVVALPMTQRHAVTALSRSQVSAFRPYTYYAAAAYCRPSETLTWSCGVNCDPNPFFHPVASGGDGRMTQFWYVGYDPLLHSVVVGHQGTKTKKIIPLVEDLEYSKKPLSHLLFPDISPAIKVHDGFRDAHARTAFDVLDAVSNAMFAFSTRHVTLVGHSLGAAIALLDAVFLPLHLPPSTKFKAVVYGLPRVGNQAFADYVDAHPSLSLTHITNRLDYIPILPGRAVGFHHPSGEVHVESLSGEWMACAGQDNPSHKCVVGQVPDIFAGTEHDHHGPYDGVPIAC
ncbi:alpha/beta-hydrolase [Cytidiella melzeri]|nr:alpha/beta-hydrolase [Cytidiella melzeri]